jgi:hypothetical protein
MSYCGPQYASSNCQCYLQVTPGIKPGSNVATSTPICAFRKDDFQYACDPGCCPAECTVDNAVSDEPMETDTGSSSGSSGLTTTDWILIVLAIIFCVLLVLGVAWASHKRKNLSG